MKLKLFLKILIGVAAFGLLLMLLLRVVAEPWLGNKIQTSFNKNSSDYLLKIDKVRISIIHPGIKLENITLSSKLEHNGHPDLTGEIESVNFKGIKPMKALFKKEIDIREVTFFNSNIQGKIPFPEKTGPPKISQYNIRIDSLFFDRTNLDIRNSLTAQRYSLTDGVLKGYDLQITKLDTLSPGILKRFDFDAMELLAVSPDSMYTIASTDINYSGTSNTLSVDSFFIHPNYPEYEFTARHQFQTDRIEAGFSSIHVNDFSVLDYLKSGKIVSSYIEIGKMNMNVFRDNRKEFKHVKKPAFQDMIYNYPGTLNIDSIGLLMGNIIYTEHAEKANEPGQIGFNEIKASIYKITNDTVYRTGHSFLEFKADALLMGKGKLTVLLKGRIFDPQNTFLVNGSISGLEIKELNPIVEKNAFVFVTSGEIDKLNFNFTANNTKANGKMILLYHGLDIAVKNKRTDDTTAIKERLMSIMANVEILDSNPIAGEGVRVGIIDYKRNPEKFLFNYCAKSILTGIKSSLVRSPKK